MAKNTETRKRIVSFAVVTLFLVFPFIFAIYLPVWNHNPFGIALIALIAGGTLFLANKNKSFAYGLVTALGHVVLTVGVWNHNWFVIATIMTIATIRVSIAARKKFSALAE